MVQLSGRADPLSIPGQVYCPAGDLALAQRPGSGGGGAGSLRGMRPRVVHYCAVGRSNAGRPADAVESHPREQGDTTSSRGLAVLGGTGLLTLTSDLSRANDVNSHLLTNRRRSKSRAGLAKTRRRTVRRVWR